MQRVTFTTSIPHIISHLHSPQKAHHTSLILRFNVHETLQINQLNFGISNNTFCQGL